MAPNIDEKITAHRGDIYGLRAIAVLSVILFHLNPTGITGGYIGVDVFFVISGYLITNQIRTDLSERRFFLVDFYAKRIRRLYPALFVLITATTLASFFILFPSELINIAQASAAAMFYVSNFYFHSEVDYFSHGDVRPLLHTWTLAVEEQFYIFFPALLVLLRKLPAHVIALIIAAMALLSLASAEILLNTDSSAAFFWSISRFWEFAAGALATFLARSANSATASSLQAAFGLATVLLSVFLLTDTSAVPGVITLAPVLGAVLIVRAGETRNRISDLLDLAPLRYLGRISYSLYLVHWPLIAFTRILYNDSLPFALEAALLMGSIGLAAFMYHMVELPARRISLPGRRGLILGLGFGATTIVAAASAATIVSNGFPERYPAKARRIMTYLDYDPQASFRSGICLLNVEAQREDAVFDEARCVGRSRPDRPQILLIGDSYAAQYYEPLRRAFPTLEIAQVTATGCRPVLEAAGAERCRHLMNHAFSKIITPGRFSAIVMSARWSDADIGKLPATLAFLGQRTSRLYVLGPMVEYSRPLPRLIALSELRGDQEATVKASRLLERAERLDARLAAIAHQAGEPVRYVSVVKELCGEDSCITVTASGAPTQFDHGHLTREGAALILGKLKMQGRLSALGQFQDPADRSGIHLPSK